MNFVHSYWLKPALNKRFDADSKTQLKANLLCFALSLTYIHKIGETITLYADKDALSYLREFPYDNIKILNVPDDANHRLWAQGKFCAFKEISLDDIHIDGDAFIKSRKLLPEFDKGDVVVQSLEEDGLINSREYWECREFLRNKTLPYDPYKLPKTVGNSGVIKFNNQELKDKYIKNYFSSISVISLTDDIPDICNLDIVLEQQFLSTLCEVEDYDIHPLFKTCFEPYLRSNYKDYTHLIGGKKYLCYPLLIKELRNLDENLLNLVMDIFNEIDKRES